MYPLLIWMVSRQRPSGPHYDSPNRAGSIDAIKSTVFAGQPKIDPFTENVDRQAESGHPEINLISKRKSATARPLGGQSTSGQQL
jgi:hypothetical protein